MSAAILVLNAGSSTLKFGLYDVETLRVLGRGSVDTVGVEPRLKTSGSEIHIFDEIWPPPAVGGHEKVVAWLLDAIHQVSGLNIAAAGHRVVHGGARFALPVLVDAEILTELERLIPLAPAHQPQNIAGIRVVAKTWPSLPQVACFDTAFHRTQPRVAQLSALPRELLDDGFLRYGFHGLSYEYIASVLPEIAGERADGRVLIAHLGHGASLCAMQNRRSIATTMGFTALDGLMMSTRSGMIDPGIILYLIRERGMNPSAVADLLNNRSGLLGVSGMSDDVRVLEASDHPFAIEALDLFTYRAVREIGSLIAALGGLDILVFTAGIGEHSAGVRDRICSALAWTGVSLDRERNLKSETRIGSESSAVDVLVIPTNEEASIARGTRAVIWKR